MFAVKNKNNQYLTRKGFDAEFSFTNNYNFAYVWNDEKEAEKVKNILSQYQNINIFEIEVVKM